MKMRDHDKSGAFEGKEAQNAHLQSGQLAKALGDCEGRADVDERRPKQKRRSKARCYRSRFKQVKLEKKARRPKKSKEGDRPAALPSHKGRYPCGPDS